MNKFSHLSKRLDTLSTKAKILGAIYLILSFSVLYHFAYARKIIPGVKIGSVDVGGMTFDSAKQKLISYEDYISKKLILKTDEKEFEIDADAVGLVYNWDASLSRAYEVGRTGNILTDTKDKVAGLFKELYIAAFYEYNDDLFHAKFSQLKGEINKEGSNARFKLNDKGDLEVVQGYKGYKVSDGDLFKILVYAFDRIDFESRDLPIEISEPNILAYEIEPLISAAEKVVYNEIAITNGTKKWTVTKAQLADLLAFEKDNGDIKLALDEPKFKGLLESISFEANQSARGKVTEVEGDKVLKFEITDAGTEIDTKLFTRAFRDTYLTGGKSVALVLKPSDPPKDLSSYGIFALLGEGSSKYVGSIRARVHNLTLAAERTNGVLVPPNGIYSLNSAVGDISGKTGFDAAYIIKGGRTVLGEGGGVCQTSTTLFRAVLNSGLPVVLRYPHAYRVSYYEQDSKPGFDAAIFQPTLDFQFKNDTPNYILVQSSADTDKYTLNFKIYGTPDGRSVEITEPVITGQIAPAEAQYIDDPTLEKGRTIQVEHAAWGSNVSFMRTVKRGGEVINTETFKSRYQPWRSVFRVGTKE